MSFSISWTDVPESGDSEPVSSFFSLSDAPEKSIPAKKGAEHLFVSGDNYPVLKFLLPEFKGKVDFIYIDPPYNTGKKSFTYNDSFEVDAWLSFMKRRLMLARDFLRPDGCIFIAIGQDELYRLKLLCDSIFGEKNFINDFMWLHGKGKKDSFSRTMQQSTLCYAKDRKKLRPFEDYEVTGWAEKNADGDPRGNWFSGSISFSEKRSSPLHPNFFQIVSPGGVKWERQWLVNREEMQNLIEDNRIYWGSAPDFANVPREKIFNGQRNKIIPKNIVDTSETTRAAQKHLNSLLGQKNTFDNPKPVSLIEHFLKIARVRKDAVIMDFFAGSGTTFEAVVGMNKKDGGKRRCLMVQKPESILHGGPAFSTISELCYARIKKVIPPEDGITFKECREL
ncbi:MAG: site-specific DNA-methyltransferase [Treponema sp.]|nr:site-specific DNA-methyltransferase [Treponema sp.]